jgi:hypothetical protein
MMRTSLLCLAAALVLSLPACGDDPQNNPPPTTPEVCGNGQDDDGNGQSDCVDLACAAEASCTGKSCGAVIPLADDVPTKGDTTGGIADSKGNCTGSFDNTLAQVFAFTGGGDKPGQDGVLHVELDSATDQGFYIRTDCEDDMSEIGCIDSSFGGVQEHTHVKVKGGQTVFIYVDTFTDPMQAGPFTLKVHWEIPAEETACADGEDNDYDELTDCQDPACQSAAACKPGMTATGSPCMANNECVANKNDPLCLQNPSWPEGYCSEYCNLNDDDCSNGAKCVQDGLGDVGRCLHACTTHADCRMGYQCDTNQGSVCTPGSPQEVCDNGMDDNGDMQIDCADPTCSTFPACDEAMCDDLQDNDGDQLIDCQDAACQALPLCKPGMGAVGTACTAASDCASATGNDPACIPEALGFTGGYCAEFCAVGGTDCPSGSMCVDLLGATSGLCFATCTMDTDCRMGYACMDPSGGNNKVCFKM